MALDSINLETSEFKIIKKKRKNEKNEIKNINKEGMKEKENNNRKKE